LDYGEKPRIAADWVPLLEKYYLCKAFDFRIPPRAGGMRDQNWLEMRLFSVIRLEEQRTEAELTERAAREHGNSNTGR